MNKYWFRFLSAAVLTIFLVACGGDVTVDDVQDAVDQAQEVVEQVATEAGDEIQEAVEAVVEEVEDATDGEEEMADEEMADSGVMAGGAGFIDRALAGEFEGTTVTMLSVFSGQDEINFNESVAPFEEATGIDFVYEGTSEFEAIVTTRVQGGDASDIIGFPQPGLLANFVRAGEVVDLNEHFSSDYMEGQYIDSWLDMATFAGPDGDVMAGVWHRTNGKSQVWYPKAAWDAAGYPIPTTHEEMLELMDLIVADG
ncbi:MAG: ABC transporter substrate-binding protein, partial [Chloroflexota bacterium]